MYSAKARKKEENRNSIDTGEGTHVLVTKKHSWMIGELKIKVGLKIRTFHHKYIIFESS